MNRWLKAQGVRFVSVPHSRGDEPPREKYHDKKFWAFPTAVGMNRYEDSEKIRLASVPHSRGDEPRTDFKQQ